MSRLCRLKNKTHGEDGQWACKMITTLQALLAEKDAEISELKEDYKAIMRCLRGSSKGVVPVSLLNAAEQKVSAGKRIILTGKEIKALAEFVGLDVVNHHPICEETLEAEIVISEKEEAGRKYKLAHFYDYPDETCIDLNDF